MFITIKGKKYDTDPLLGATASQISDCKRDKQLLQQFLDSQEGRDTLFSDQFFEIIKTLRPSHQGHLIVGVFFSLAEFLPSEEAKKHLFALASDRRVLEYLLISGQNVLSFLMRSEPTAEIKNLAMQFVLEPTQLKRILAYRDGCTENSAAQVLSYVETPFEAHHKTDELIDAISKEDELLQNPGILAALNKMIPESKNAQKVELARKALPLILKITSTLIDPYKGRNYRDDISFLVNTLREDETKELQSATQPNETLSCLFFKSNNDVGSSSSPSSAPSN